MAGFPEDANLSGLFPEDVPLIDPDLSWVVDGGLLGVWPEDGLDGFEPDFAGDL